MKGEDNMFVAVGILFLGIGLFMLIRPQTVFTIIESWKSADWGEPSKLYLWNTRIGGAAVLAVGILSIVVQFLE